MAVSVRHDVGLLPGLHGTTFATRCRATSEAAWDSRAFNGDGHGWLSLRLSGHVSSRRNTVAQGWLQTLLCSACCAQSRCVAAGRCRGSWRSQGYSGMCQQKSSRNKGLPHTCRPNWSGIGLETTDWSAAEINLGAA